jgi:MtN3 and saliva related transmembrane protein
VLRGSAGPPPQVPPLKNDVCIYLTFTIFHLMKISILDPNVGTVMNVFLVIGNVINIVQNIPQVVKTYNTKSTRDFSALFLILRIIGNLIWIAYAVNINSLLLVINNSVTVAATAYLGYYKIREMWNDRKRRIYTIINEHISNDTGTTIDTGTEIIVSF